MPFAAAAARASVPRFEVRPAYSTSAAPASRFYFTLHDSPGSSHRHTVLVSNRTNRAIRLAIAPVDALTAQASGVIYTVPGEPPRATGRWVTADRGSVRIGAWRSALVTFSVSVPRGTRSGDYVAGLAFEQTGPITVRATVGIEVVVPGAASPRVALDGLALGGARRGGAAVIVTLANLGATLCDPRLVVAIGHAGGVPLRYSQLLAPVLPGSVIDYPFAWPGTIRPGRYQLSASATNCGVASAIHGVVRVASPIVAFRRFAGAPLAARLSASRSTALLRGRSLYIVAAALGLLLLAGIAALFRWPRRRVDPALLAPLPDVLPPPPELLDRRPPRAPQPGAPPRSADPLHIALAFLAGMLAALLAPWRGDRED